MELNVVRDGFDRVAKKQKMSSSKTLEVICCVRNEIEQSFLKLQKATDEPNSSLNHKDIAMELCNKLAEIAPLVQIEKLNKEVNVGISKYTKIVEKNFYGDISKACRNVQFDLGVLNDIIAKHFYRESMFDVGDCFANEVEDSPDITMLKPVYMEMMEILESLKSRNVEPALNWTLSNRDKLSEHGSKLELKLRRLQFVEIVKKGNREDALMYARTHLSHFAQEHVREIQKLMACLLWIGRLEVSPYADFISDSDWENLDVEVRQEFCKVMGESHKSPLCVTLGAGIEALPTLLKLASVMSGSKKKEWESMTQLPVDMDLPTEYQFHSIFVCPVSREQATEENPPMRLPCGHVLCKQSISKLSKGSSRMFKCPYCPTEASVAQCRQLYI